MLEGGDFECYIHNFKTGSIDEWNAHCMESGEHTEEGSTACTGCGATIEFHNLPFQPIKGDGSKGIALQCPDCSEKTQQASSAVTITKKSGGTRWT